MENEPEETGRACGDDMRLRNSHSHPHTTRAATSDFEKMKKKKLKMGLLGSDRPVSVPGFSLLLLLSPLPLLLFFFFFVEIGKFQTVFLGSHNSTGRAYKTDRSGTPADLDGTTAAAVCMCVRAYVRR